MDDSDVILVAGNSRSSYDSPEDDLPGVPSTIPPKINMQSTDQREYPTEPNASSNSLHPARIEIHSDADSDIRSTPIKRYNIPGSDRSNIRQIKNQHSVVSGGGQKFGYDSDDSSPENQSPTVVNNDESYRVYRFAGTDPLNAMRSEDSYGNQRTNETPVNNPAYFRIDTHKVSTPNSSVESRSSVSPRNEEHPAYYSLDSRASPNTTNRNHSWTPLHGITPSTLREEQEFSPHNNSNSSARTELQATGRWTNADDNTDREDSAAIGRSLQCPAVVSDTMRAQLGVIPPVSLVSPSPIVNMNEPTTDKNTAKQKPNGSILEAPVSNISSEVPLTLSQTSNESTSSYRGPLPAERPHRRQDLASSVPPTQKRTSPDMPPTAIDRRKSPSIARVSDDITFDISRSGSNVSPISSNLHRVAEWPPIDSARPSDHSSLIDREIDELENDIHKLANSGLGHHDDASSDSDTAQNRGDQQPRSSTSSIYLEPPSNQIIQKSIRNSREYIPSRVSSGRKSSPIQSEEDSVAIRTSRYMANHLDSKISANEPHNIESIDSSKSSNLSLQHTHLDEQRSAIRSQSSFNSPNIGQTRSDSPVRGLAARHLESIDHQRQTGLSSGYPTAPLPSRGKSSRVGTSEYSQPVSEFSSRHGSLTEFSNRIPENLSVESYTANLSSSMIPQVAQKIPQDVRVYVAPEAEVSYPSSKSVVDSGLDDESQSSRIIDAPPVEYGANISPRRDPEPTRALNYYEDYAKVESRIEYTMYVPPHHEEIVHECPPIVGHWACNDGSNSISHPYDQREMDVGPDNESRSSTPRRGLINLAHSTGPSSSRLFDQNLVSSDARDDMGSRYADHPVNGTRRSSQIHFAPSPLHQIPERAPVLETSISGSKSNDKDREPDEYDRGDHYCRRVSESSESSSDGESDSRLFLKDAEGDPIKLAGHREVVSRTNDIKILISMARRSRDPEELLFVCQVVTLGDPNRGKDLTGGVREKWKFAVIDEMESEHNWPAVLSHAGGFTSSESRSRPRDICHRGREELWYFRTTFRGHWRTLVKPQLFMRILCLMFNLKWPSEIPFDIRIPSVLAAEGSVDLSAALTALNVSFETEVVRHNRNRVTWSGEKSSFLFMETLGCEMIQNFLMCTLRIPGFLYFDQNIYNQAMDLSDLMIHLNQSSPNSSTDLRLVAGKRDHRIPGASDAELAVLRSPGGAQSSMRFTYWKPSDSAAGTFVLMNLSSGRYIGFTPRNDSAESIISSFREMLSYLRFPNAQFLVPDPAYLKFIRLMDLFDSGMTSHRTGDRSPGKASDVAVGGSPLKHDFRWQDYKEDEHLENDVENFRMVEEIINNWSREHKCSPIDSDFSTTHDGKLSIELNCIEREDANDRNITYEAFLTIQTTPRTKEIDPWRTINFKVFEKHIPSLTNLFTIFRTGAWYLNGLFNFSNSETLGVRRALLSVYWPSPTKQIPRHFVTHDLKHLKFKTVAQFYKSVGPRETPRSATPQPKSSSKKKTTKAEHPKSVYVPYVASRQQQVPTITPHILDPVFMAAQQHYMSLFTRPTENIYGIDVDTVGNTYSSFMTSSVPRGIATSSVPRNTMTSSVTRSCMGSPFVGSAMGASLLGGSMASSVPGSGYLYGPPLMASSIYGSQIMMPAPPEIPVALRGHSSMGFGWVQPQAPQSGVKVHHNPNKVHVPKEVWESPEWHFPGLRAVFKDKLEKKQPIFSEVPQSSEPALFTLDASPDLRFRPIPTISSFPSHR